MTTNKFHSAKHSLYVVILLSMVNVVNYVDRMALAVLSPSIKSDLGLSDAQLGVLLGFAFAVFYATCAIPIARASDLGNRRNIIAGALAVWSLMTALSGAAQNFWHLFLARVGVGAGEAACNPAAQSMICDYVPPPRRPGAFAIHSFGQVVGLTIGMSLAGVLADSVGWRLSFLALGLPGIAFAVALRIFLREPSRGCFEPVRHDQAVIPFTSAAASLWRSKTYRFLVLFQVSGGFFSYGLLQWFPSYCERVFGVSMPLAGTYLGLGVGVGLGLGMLFGGFLGNRAAQRDVGLPLKVCTVSLVLSLPFALASLFVSSVHHAILLVSLAELCAGMSAGPVVSAVCGVVRPTTRATAVAITTFFASVLGFGLGPYCVGVLSDMLSSSFGAQSLRYALIAPVCMLPVMAFGLYGAAKRLPVDLKLTAAQADAVPFLQTSGGSLLNTKE